MFITLGSYEKEGMEFNLYAKQYKDKIFLSANSLRQALNFTSSGNQRFKQDTKDLPKEILEGKTQFYSISDAISYIEKFRVNITQSTILLMSLIAKELLC